jgi:hypothetical protein
MIGKEVRWWVLEKKKKKKKKKKNLLKYIKLIKDIYIYIYDRVVTKCEKKWRHHFLSLQGCIND